jgi:uncharacterized protein (UPF0332 family)
MSSEEQAGAYLEEAELTLSSAQVIHNSAVETHEELWAQVVKNGYDAIEQAVSAAIAHRDETIPRAHPAKINTFLDLYHVSEDLEDTLLYWLRRRSDSQSVDIRGDQKYGSGIWGTRADEHTGRTP